MTSRGRPEDNPARTKGIRGGLDPLPLLRPRQPRGGEVLRCLRPAGERVREPRSRACHPRRRSLQLGRRSLCSAVSSVPEPGSRSEGTDSANVRLGTFGHPARRRRFENAICLREEGVHRSALGHAHHRSALRTDRVQHRAYIVNPFLQSGGHTGHAVRQAASRWSKSMPPTTRCRRGGRASCGSSGRRRISRSTSRRTLS